MRALCFVTLISISSVIVSPGYFILSLATVNVLTTILLFYLRGFHPPFFSPAVLPSFPCSVVGGFPGGTITPFLNAPLAEYLQHKCLSTFDLLCCQLLAVTRDTGALRVAHPPMVKVIAFFSAICMIAPLHSSQELRRKDLVVISWRRDLHILVEVLVVYYVAPFLIVEEPPLPSLLKTCSTLSSCSRLCLGRLPLVGILW